MAMIAANPDLARGVALFNGLADRNRLAIIRALAVTTPVGEVAGWPVGGELRVTDLVSLLGLAQGTVSGHLACLRDCGLVTARPEGRQMFYRLAHPELIDLLAAAESVLAKTGDAVELCPNYGGGR